MKFNNLFTAIEEMTQQLGLEIDNIVEKLSGENMAEIEEQAMAQMHEAEVMCFDRQPVAELDGKTVTAYIKEMEADMFLELLADPMLYLIDFLPDSVEEKVASYKGTEYASKVAAVTKQFCTLNFDSQSTEVATALKLYSKCGDADLFDVIFRLNEASFRMVEQGDADWEVVQDAVVVTVRGGGSAVDADPLRLRVNFNHFKSVATLLLIVREPQIVVVGTVALSTKKSQLPK